MTQTRPTGKLGACLESKEVAAQHALPADRFARRARFAAADAQAVGRLSLEESVSHEIHV